MYLKVSVKLANGAARNFVATQIRTGVVRSQSGKDKPSYPTAPLLQCFRKQRLFIYLFFTVLCGIFEGFTMTLPKFEKSMFI